MANYHYVDSGLDSSDSEDEQQIEVDPIILAYNVGYEEGQRTAREQQQHDHQYDLRDLYQQGKEEGYQAGIVEMLEEQQRDDGKELDTPEELIRQREINKRVNATLEEEAAARDFEEENWDHLFDN